MESSQDPSAQPETQIIERRFSRFSAQLPVTVLTNPVPPHWVPLHFKGETIEIGRGGTSVLFPFDVTRFLYRAKSVRLLLGHSDHLGSHHSINARVAWADGTRVGFEFTQVLRSGLDSGAVAWDPAKTEAYRN